MNKPTAMKSLLVGLFLLTFAGCVSLTPEQQVAADALRHMADKTARLYGKRPIYLMFGPHVAGEGGSFRGGMITVSDRVILHPHREALMAHELAHYLLDHHLDQKTFPSLREYYEWQRPREVEANTKAVEILQRVKEVSERDAFKLFHDFLLAIHRSGSSLPTHHPACEEIGDLVKRFPAQWWWTKDLECAPATLTLSGAAKRPPRAIHAPSRDGSVASLIVYAYFTDTPPAQGTFLRSTVNPNMPPGVNEFDANSDQVVALFLALDRIGRVLQIISRWHDEQGVERKVIERVMDQTGTRGAWTWQTHLVPVSELKLYPGKWTVKVSVDGTLAGEYIFRLVRGGTGAPK